MHPTIVRPAHFLISGMIASALGTALWAAHRLEVGTVVVTAPAEAIPKTGYPEPLREIVQAPPVMPVPAPPNPQPAKAEAYTADSETATADAKPTPAPEPVATPAPAEEVLALNTPATVAKVKLAATVPSGENGVRGVHRPEGVNAPEIRSKLDATIIDRLIRTGNARLLVTDSRNNERCVTFRGTFSQPGDPLWAEEDRRALSAFEDQRPLALDADISIDLVLRAIRLSRSTTITTAKAWLLLRRDLDQRILGRQRAASINAGVLIADVASTPGEFVFTSDATVDFDVLSLIKRALPKTTVSKPIRQP
jgi:hypothetical protein